MNKENKEFTFGKMVVPSNKIGHTGGVALKEMMMSSA